MDRETKVLDEGIEFKKLSIDDLESIRSLFVSVFTTEPWNDDWSDTKQLNMYLNDLIGQSNSLTYGMYEGNELIGVSMGHIKHWYTGTEYSYSIYAVDGMELDVLENVLVDIK